MNSDPLLTASGSIATVLFFGTLTAMIVRAIRVNPIIGYILLGVVSKALGFKLFDETTIDTLAQLGVVFLPFDLGLHFSWRDIRQRAADIFVFGSVQSMRAGLGMVGALDHRTFAALFRPAVPRANVELISSHTVRRSARSW